jgi:hypothetical protein
MGEGGVRLKVYFAGNVGMVKREKKNGLLYKQRLFSFFYISSPDQTEYNVFEWVKSNLLRRRGMK